MKTTKASRASKVPRATRKGLAAHDKLIARVRRIGRTS